jgi:hypothetical protein
MTRLIVRVMTFIVLFTLGRAAYAQQSSPASGLEIEQIQNGWVIAPDVRFTQVNDRTATLAGAYGGWLTDRTLLIGAAAYWLANRDDDFKMQYFGGLVRWTIGGDKRFAVSPGGLVGLGDATLSETYGALVAHSDHVNADFSRMDGPHGFRPVPTDARFRLHDDFFVAEPQVNALWTITPWLRLNAGAGYRLIGWADVPNEHLRGASGSIGIQFGGK